MRVEIHGKLTADAVLSDEGLKHFPWQADRLAVFSDHPHPIVLRRIKVRVWCSLMDKLKIAKGMEPVYQRRLQNPKTEP